MASHDERSDDGEDHEDQRIDGELPEGERTGFEPDQADDDHSHDSAPSTGAPHDHGENHEDQRIDGELPEGERVGFEADQADDDSDDSAPSTGAPPEVGEIVGNRYALLNVLGRGSSGVVFGAHDLRLGRPVAVKILHPHNASKPEMVGRFYLEALVPANLGHPNVVVIYDFKQRRDRSYYLVQELLEGTTLRRRLRERGRLSVLEALDALVPIMGALVTVHRIGVVHRDVKPENIFLALRGDREVPKLIDFGVAKDIDPVDQGTFPRRPIGTPMYMAPEQITRKDVVDGRADVWAVGIILFELIAGCGPFGYPTPFEMLKKLHDHERPPPLSAHIEGAPSELVGILESALEPTVEDRFATMAAFLSRLLDFAQSLDPDLVFRHRVSIPTELDRSSVRPRPTVDSTSMPLIAGFRAELDDPFAETLQIFTDPMDLHAIAERELAENALESALEHAEQAARSPHATTQQRGALRLIQAIACIWLGRFADAELWARLALKHLPRGERSWYLALGHLATACGGVGKNDDLHGVVTDLDQQAAVGDEGVAYVVAASQTVLVLVRAGMLDDAQRLFARLQQALASIAGDRVGATAWRDVAQAELALHAGDVVAYLDRSEAAARAFGEAGDARYVCLQRANIGNAHMLLGSYVEAEAQLRESLRVGAPMKLGLVEASRSNLSFTLARLGRLSEAMEMATAAINGCIAQRHRRAESFSRLFLAEIHWLAGDLSSAEAEVALAIAKAARTPAAGAHAKALLAMLHLARGRLSSALTEASEAMYVLRSLGGVEQGEAFIRLADVRALRANGHHALARERAAEARRRLLDQADRLTDPSWRRSFLENIPENVELCRLCD